MLLERLDSSVIGMDKLFGVSLIAVIDLWLSFLADLVSFATNRLTSIIFNNTDTTSSKLDFVTKRPVLILLPTIASGPNCSLFLAIVYCYTSLDSKPQEVRGY